VFEATFLGRLPDPGYGAVLTVTGDRVFLGQQLLRAGDARLVVAAVPGDAAARPAAPAVPPASRYFALGVRHILTGADHLLFLLGLLIGCRRLRSMLGVVTCFTATHSLTLALAALGVVTLSPRIVEPFIAATIAFVGIENVLRGDEPRGRLALTFAFGLVHGLGFASALRDTGLGAHGARLALPLLSFNLGVEAGQIAVAAPAWLLLWRLRASGTFSRAGVRWASLLVAGVGLYWLVERVMA
jgi:hydrogenase/urease accessory protein HupE